MAEVATSNRIGASLRAGAAMAMGLVPMSGLEANVGTTLRPAPVKQTPTMLRSAAIRAWWPMAPKWPLLYTLTTPTPTFAALSMASRMARGPVMRPRRRSPSMTAVPGVSRSSRQPGAGLSLPSR